MNRGSDGTGEKAPALNCGSACAGEKALALNCGSGAALALKVGIAEKTLAVGAGAGGEEKVGGRGIGTDSGGEKAGGCGGLKSGGGLYSGGGEKGRGGPACGALPPAATDGTQKDGATAGALTPFVRLDVLGRAAPGGGPPHTKAGAAAGGGAAPQTKAGAAAGGGAAPQLKAVGAALGNTEPPFAAKGGCDAAAAAAATPFPMGEA